MASTVAGLLASIPASQANVDTAFLDIVASLNTASTPATRKEDLCALGDAVLASAAVRDVSVVVARQVFDAIAAHLKQSSNNTDLQTAVADHLLEKLQDCGQTNNLLEQMAALCDISATGYEADENFAEAAKRLAAIPLDSSQRRVSQEDKVRIWVRIVRDYLEEDDSTAAESYLNKVKGVIFDVHDQELNLHFKLSQARINDAKREFLSASTAYHDISYSPAIAEEERLHTLSMAIKCAILAPAGPTRSRVLGRLYKDDRAQTLANDYSILEKMFLNRLLTPAEVSTFSESLQPHQLATTADGSTVLAKAVVEHNLLGVSLLYRNIPLADLAVLLGLDGDGDGNVNVAKTEETTARMIEQGRLLGRIDQLSGLVWFEEGGVDGSEASGQRGSGRADSAVDKELRQWGANAQSLAEEVETISNELQKAYPTFVAANLAV